MKSESGDGKVMVCGVEMWKGCVIFVIVIRIKWKVLRGKGVC